MDVRLILVPYDSAHRGRRMGAGPERLAPALAARLERGGHRVTSTTTELPDDVWPAEVGAAFALARLVAERARAARGAGAFPVVVAGNCMATLGAVAALGAGARVAWFDAHGDFNTPDTTTGGFLDGMALATLVGRCWPQLARGVPGFVPVAEGDVRLLGARDLDPLEADTLDRSAVRRIAPADVGPGVADPSAPPSPLHVHLDLDVLDPSEGRVNRYAAPAGVTLGALTGALRALGSQEGVASLTLSAYDPAFDGDGRVERAAVAAVAALLDR